MTFVPPPETEVLGIPVERWYSRDLMDQARMTTKQRYTYFFTMCSAEAKLLSTKGNFVGEKPERPIDVAQMMREREAAFQRALAYQMEIMDD